MNDIFNNILIIGYIIPMALMICFGILVLFNKAVSELFKVKSIGDAFGFVVCSFIPVLNVYILLELFGKVLEDNTPIHK